MRKAIAIVLVVLAGLLIVNTLVTDAETKGPSADLGHTLKLPGGSIQARDDGSHGNHAIVLLHGFAASMHWWTPVAERLAPNLYVVRIDLLGHGGSAKPRHGYSIPNQARLVDEALGQLRVRRAVIVGHSMGGLVATALAERNPGLVRGLVLVDSPRNQGAGELPFTAKLGFVPVIGEALRHLVTDGMVRHALEDAFAPGFEVPDQFVRDFHRMTYSSYDSSHSQSNEYLREKELDARLTAVHKPLLVMFGSRDELVDLDSFAQYENVPGATVTRIDGAGHSPMMEQPERAATLIERFERRVARAEP
jgi:pimeloyl-ACP methyl ester carboxylesterase